MLANDIRIQIIRPALQSIGLWSASAEVLIYGTGMVESGYNHLVQIGSPQGGGLGFFQMEKSDYEDIYAFLRHPKNVRLYNSVISCCYYCAFPMDSSVLVHNIKFAAVMCRLHYLRTSQAIPELADGGEAFAEYHKVYYNSLDGAASVTTNTKIFQGIIDDK